MEATFQIDEFGFKLSGPEKVESKNPRLGQYLVWKLTISGTNNRFLEEEGLHLTDGDGMSREMINHLYRMISSNWVDANHEKVTIELEEIRREYAANNAPEPQPPPS